MPPPLALGLLHGLLSTQTPRTISTLMNFTSCLRLRQKLPTIFKPPQVDVWGKECERRSWISTLKKWESSFFTCDITQAIFPWAINAADGKLSSQAKSWLVIPPTVAQYWWVPSSSITWLEVAAWLKEPPPPPLHWLNEIWARSYSPLSERRNETFVGNWGINVPLLQVGEA